jgi:DNA polymerase
MARIEIRPDRVDRRLSLPRAQSARPFVPASRKPSTLRRAARRCTGCDLFATATQVVFGAGPVSARLMLVGEQPGDEEDKQGAPFVGPAGGLLDRALGEAGIARADVYVTNAVKHFAWEPRGKRRIHRKPRLSEVRACWPWLEAEIASLRPAVIVCLGATAVQALMGPRATLTSLRGQTVQTPFGPVVATLHPAAVLRAPDAAARAARFAQLVEDLKRAAKIPIRTR